MGGDYPYRKLYHQNRKIKSPPSLDLLFPHIFSKNRDVRLMEDAPEQSREMRK